MLPSYVTDRAYNHEFADPSRIRCHTNNPYLVAQSPTTHRYSRKPLKCYSSGYLPHQAFPSAMMHFDGFSPLHLTACPIVPQNPCYPMSPTYYLNSPGYQPCATTPFGHYPTPSCHPSPDRHYDSYALSEPPRPAPVHSSTSSPSSMRFNPPMALAKALSTTSSPSIPSLTPPGTPEPALTPEQFIAELQRIRLQGLTSYLPIGRFRIQGESQPVSVSRPRADGPFVIQHYLPNGKEDAISVAHVLAGVGVIVWCPPPKVQFVGNGI
ncbi:hypothetical protein BDV93DRAFT_524521 [Ceratobasidium sp. AG-I]|nr:hypothetical protein BDV93DRAFT_524521 [Ceratobasidium sp. AG-I]